MALEHLQQLYQRGAFAEVVDGCQQVATSDPQFAVTLRLCAQALVRMAQPLQAAEVFLRAAAAEAKGVGYAQSECLFNAAAACLRSGQRELASYLLCCDLLQRRSRPVCVQSLQLLPELLADLPDSRLAALALASECDRSARGFLQQLVNAVALRLRAELIDCPATDTASVPGAATGGASAVEVSIIVCSHRDANYARFVQRCGAAMAGSSWEVVRISDAMAMGEGYRRGMQLSRGELLLFVHDDVELLSPDFGERLRGELAECDLLCAVGATQFEGPAWFCAGPAHTRGALARPLDGGGLELNWASAPDPEALLQVVDGFFLAGRRQVFEAVGWLDWDQAGFHGYDIDFSYRAARAGYRLRAASRLLLAHASEGDYSDAWLHAAQEVCRRLGVAAAGNHRSPSWASARVDSRWQASRLFDQVNRVHAGAHATLTALAQQLRLRIIDSALLSADERLRAVMDRAASLVAGATGNTAAPAG